MLVIDGHNLIPKIPGWSLSEMDDEARLIQLLQLYTRVKRKTLQVFFDGAPPGQAGTRPYGMVTAHFVPIGNIADEAIRQYLVGLKKGAKNVTVVSSDRMVQVNARALGASVLPSEEFARELVDLRAGLSDASAKARSRGPGAGAAAAGTAGATETVGGLKSERELAEWYDLFKIDPNQAEKPIEPVKPKAPPKAKPAAGRPGKSAQTPRKHHGFPKKNGG